MVQPKLSQFLHHVLGLALWLTNVVLRDVLRKVLKNALRNVLRNVITNVLRNILANVLWNVLATYTLVALISNKEFEP